MAFERIGRTVIRRRWVRWALLLVVGAIALRAALPFWVTQWVNGHIDRMGDYHGEIRGVELHLWRGAYTLKGLVVVKRDSEIPDPFLTAPTLELGLSWRDLVRGEVEATAVFHSPRVVFVNDEQTGDQAGVGGNWRRQLEALAPFRLDQMAVHDGVVRFRNYSATPPVDIEVKDVWLTLEGLTNHPDRSKRSAMLEVTGTLPRQGLMEINARFDPLDTLEDFHLHLALLELELAGLNELLKAYAHLDVERGHGEFLVELEARDGQLTGYAKPLFRDIEIFDWELDLEQQNDSPLRALWEVVADALANLFKNQEVDQLATRVDIQGDIHGAETSTVQAIIGILRNAFVQAYQPQFEDLPTRGESGDD